jgi:hypothetical protein
VRERLYCRALGNFVSRIIVEDDGTTLRGTKAYDHAEFWRRRTSGFAWSFFQRPDGVVIVDFTAA